MNRIDAMVEAGKRFKYVSPEDKECRTCGVVKLLDEFSKGGGQDGLRDECSNCNGKRANAWYRSYPERVKVRGKLRWAIKSGKVPLIGTQLCVECGEQADHYHHEDYSHPLEVIPLCRKHHKDLHKQRRFMSS
jgi:hypothetical protein